MIGRVGWSKTQHHIRYRSELACMRADLLQHTFAASCFLSNGRHKPPCNGHYTVHTADDKEHMCVIAFAFEKMEAAFSCHYRISRFLTSDSMDSARKHVSHVNIIVLSSISTIASSLRLISLALPKDIAKLLQRTSCQLVLLPQVGCQETVCVADCYEGSLECVFEGFGTASR